MMNKKSTFVQMVQILIQYAFLWAIINIFYKLDSMGIVNVSFIVFADVNLENAKAYAPLSKNKSIF